MASIRPRAVRTNTFVAAFCTMVPRRHDASASGSGLL